MELYKTRKRKINMHEKKADKILREFFKKAECGDSAVVKTDVMDELAKKEHHDTTEDEMDGLTTKSKLQKKADNAKPEFTAPPGYPKNHPHDPNPNSKPKFEAPPGSKQQPVANPPKKVMDLKPIHPHNPNPNAKPEFSPIPGSVKNHPHDPNPNHPPKFETPPSANDTQVNYLKENSKPGFHDKIKNWFSKFNKKAALIEAKEQHRTAELLLKEALFKNKK